MGDERDKKIFLFKLSLNASRSNDHMKLEAALFRQLFKTINGTFQLAYFVLLFLSLKTNRLISIYPLIYFSRKIIYIVGKCSRNTVWVYFFSFSPDTFSLPLPI